MVFTDYGLHYALYNNKTGIVRNSNEKERESTMKALGKIGAAVLLALFLEVNVCYGESIGEDITSRKVKTPTYSSSGEEKHLKKGMLDKAIAEFSKAIKINPRDANAYYNRGITYYYKGQYDQAISDFNKALEINPKDAELYYNRGIANDLKGDYDQAISDFTQALELNPNYAKAYFNKALSCEKTGRIRESVEAYKAFIKYAPPQYAQNIERAKQKVIELEKR